MDHPDDYLILTEVTVADYRPMVAKMWHPTLNGNVTPNRVMIGSEIVVWWSCPRCAAVWSEAVRRRVTAEGIGHVGCTEPLPASVFITRAPNTERTSTNGSGRQATFLVDVHPEITQKWIPELNQGIDIGSIKLSERGRFWWTCPTCQVPWHAAVDTMRKGSTHRCRREYLAKVEAQAD
jgi:hypothetical protein